MSQGPEAKITIVSLTGEEVSDAAEGEHKRVAELLAFGGLLTDIVGARARKGASAQNDDPLAAMYAAAEKASPVPVTSVLASHNAKPVELRPATTGDRAEVIEPVAAELAELIELGATAIDAVAPQLHELVNS